MAQLPNVNAASNGSTAERPFGAATAFNDVNIDDFLKLMIAELQNQDPLNPLENDELVAQISQIRTVGATDKLTATLDSVLLGQNIASATNLIGADIEAISDDNQRVSGIVERVSVASGQPKLHLDLNPRAVASPDEGELEAGTYQYRVVWQENGTLFGVDPLARTGGSIAVEGQPEVDQAIQISNLPVTKAIKQVYRREGTSGPFRLVDTINDPKQSTYLDKTATEDLSGATLTGVPQMITDAARSFIVSLKNVGEIRPPNRIVQQ